ncbi:hypothetical protein PR202_ga08315 [Eleusine coracana subsp. coracana]|uniref:Glutathione S-transferase C-terminal domain-containing protein n=1 Tax=Eleusine coracana subsp. coracana TaxID=191504 RepID=A0AAV5C093_ELECO|nr:hypothetical protein QOZ80_1AG0046460 [Eleusine coracana subsp. coracana]GJM91896.1 hypothetical protein PR202_ga08315 [Eleusine coracana subsp. coracana]
MSSKLVRLIGCFGSPFVQRAEVALRLKGQLSRQFWISFLTADDAQKAAKMKEAKLNVALVEAQLNGKRFFGGDAIGFLDIAVSWLAYWLRVFEEANGLNLVTDEEFPAFRRWAQCYVNDETVKQCPPNRDQLVASFTARKDMYLTRAKRLPCD